MRIESWPEPEVPSEFRTQVLALQRREWPPDDPAQIAAEHDPALRPVSLLLIDDRTVVAALDLLSKDISHGGERYAASGLSTVVTDSSFRRKGHGRRLVEAGRDAMREAGADLGIFTCDRPLQSFYQAAGWFVLPGSVLVGGTPEEPFPSDRFDKVVMAAFFSQRARRHEASFHDARIELYPGPIDKLW